MAFCKWCVVFSLSLFVMYFQLSFWGTFNFLFVLFILLPLASFLIMRFSFVLLFFYIFLLRSVSPPYHGGSCFRSFVRSFVHSLITIVNEGLCVYSCTFCSCCIFRWNAFFLLASVFLLIYKRPELSHNNDVCECVWVSAVTLWWSSFEIVAQIFNWV